MGSGGYTGSNTTTSTSSGTKVYSPYSADTDQPPQSISSGGFGGGMKWGPEGAS